MLSSAADRASQTEDAMSTRRKFVTDTSRSMAGLGLAAALPTSMLEAAARVAGQAEGTGLFYDPRCLAHVVPPSSSGAPRPEIKERVIRVMEVLGERGLADHMSAIGAHADPMPHIEAHHTPEHVAAIREIPVTGPLAELAVAGALGSVDAVARGDVRNAFCCVRPPGHHANNTGAEEGFCYYSNAAITARYVQSLGYEKVLIIDWDYHHGNATQNAFYDDPTVLFYSTHNWMDYPETGDPSLVGEADGRGTNINVHLECASRDIDMLRAWDEQLDPAVASFDPDFVIVSAGFDSRQDDLLGCFDVTDRAFRRMTRAAMDFADSCCEGRLVSLLEGGYNVEGLALATAAHVETLLDG
jgi:acetoin utilization deacetylase AcuC-like enzyme